MAKAYIIVYFYYFYLCAGIFLLVMTGEDNRAKRYIDKNHRKAPGAAAMKGSLKHLNHFCFRTGNFFIRFFDIRKRNNNNAPELFQDNMDFCHASETLTGYRILSSMLLGMGGICLGSGIISSLLLAATGGVLGFFIPLMVLKRSISIKAKKIDNDLPYIIDLLSVAIMAGQNIYGAFKLITAEYSGPAGRELAGFNRDIDLGMGKEGAYRNLADKKISKDFSDLVFILTQAEQYGSSLNEILKQESHQIRFKNLELAEENTRKMSILILFPLVFLILPSFVLLVGGPLLYSIGGSLFG